MLERLAAAALVATSLLVSGPAVAGVPADARCAMKKLTALGTYAKDLAKCQAKAIERGAPVDPQCVNAAAAKLPKSFTAAERDGACAAPFGAGDLPEKQGIVDALTVDVVSTLYGVATAASGCTSKQVAALGVATQRKIKCNAAAVKVVAIGALPLAEPDACLAKAELGLSSLLSAARKKADCVMENPDQPSLDAGIDAALVAIFHGGPTTTTSPPPPTTTSTSTTSTTTTSTIPGATTTSTTTTTGPVVSTTTTLPVVCGDGICSLLESAYSCYADCGGCGDGFCSGPETLVSCPSDCGFCGDGVCGGAESASSCYADCGSCGDGLCSGPENLTFCPTDCSVCGDGLCTGPENVTSCEPDCRVCGDGVCSWPWEAIDNCFVDCVDCGDRCVGG